MKIRGRTRFCVRLAPYSQLEPRTGCVGQLWSCRIGKLNIFRKNIFFSKSNFFFVFRTFIFFIRKNLFWMKKIIVRKTKYIFRFRKKMLFREMFNFPILHNHSCPTQPVRGSNCEYGANRTQKRVRPLIFIGNLPMGTTFTSWSSCAIIHQLTCSNFSACFCLIVKGKSIKGLK